MLRFKDFTNRLVHKKTVIFIIVGHEQNSLLFGFLNHTFSPLAKDTDRNLMWQD